MQSYTLDSVQSYTLDSVQSYTLDSVQAGGRIMAALGGFLTGHAGSRKFQKGVNVVTVSGATCRATPG